MEQFTIGKLAEKCGVSTDTLRYYEKIKLLKSQARSPSGYRLYQENSVRLIHFIRCAKELNFTLKEINQLLSLNTSDQAACAKIMKSTDNKIIAVEKKILELKATKDMLGALVKAYEDRQLPAGEHSILEYIIHAVSLPPAT